MFKSLKLFFWVGICVIIAYFLTDIRLGNKNLKQHIDEVVKSEKGKQFIDDSKEVLKGGLKYTLDALEGDESPKKQVQTKDSPLTNIKKEAKELVQKTKETVSEEISNEASKKLDELFKDTQKKENKSAKK